MAWTMGGRVARCDHREYGFAQVQLSKIGGDNASVDALFEGLGDEMQVRLSPSRLYPLPQTRRARLRYGCPTATSSPRSPPISTSSAARRTRPSPPLPTTPNHSMASSSTPKSRTRPAGRKWSADSCSASAAANQTGPWCAPPSSPCLDHS